MKTLLRGGHILDPSRGVDLPEGDLLIDGDEIVGIENEISADNAEVTDVSGCLVLPAFVEIHAHLREPGREDKETIETGGTAAAHGGYAVTCAMANTDPPNDNASVTRFIRERAAESSPVEVCPVAGVTRGLNGRELTDMHELADEGAVAFSDDGYPIMDAAVMRRALEYASVLDLSIITHNEDSTLSHRGVMHEGDLSFKLGLGGIPSASESVQVARDRLLLKLTGGRIHVAHVSAVETIEAVRLAKEDGLRMTAEVTPHHLLLNHEVCQTYDSTYKMNPPLRTEEDRLALIEALADGTLDAIATDHAPHTEAEKELDFDRAPMGVIGFESAFPVCYTSLVDGGTVSLERLVESFTSGPADALGLTDYGSLQAGGTAHVTVVRTDVQERISVDDFASKARNCPFDGWQVSCRVERTYVAGKLVFESGRQNGGTEHVDE